MTTVHVPHHLAPRVSARTWTGVFAAFLGLHGIAHFVGTTRLFRDAHDGTAAHWLGDQWVVTSGGLMRTVAVMWAFLGVAFIAVAVVAWMRPAMLRMPLLLVAILSLALSVMTLWAAVIGVVINAGLVWMAWARRPEVLFEAHTTAG